MLLPRVANIRITLLDTSDRRKPKVIVEQYIPTEGRQIPILFKVPLAPGSINPRHTYSVKAEILIADRVWFTTKKPIPVLTHDNPWELQIVLGRSS